VFASLKRLCLRNIWSVPALLLLDREYRAAIERGELPNDSASCRRLAEAGCSASEIASISGHASLREVARYTAAADQMRMARNAVERLRRTEGQRWP
jgi:hypothetical protein